VEEGIEGGQFSSETLKGRLILFPNRIAKRFFRYHPKEVGTQKEVETNETN
jgi:hypothetical protein